MSRAMIGWRFVHKEEGVERRRW